MPQPKINDCEIGLKRRAFQTGTSMVSSLVICDNQTPITGHEIAMNCEEYSGNNV